MQSTKRFSVGTVIGIAAAIGGLVCACFGVLVAVVVFMPTPASEVSTPPPVVPPTVPLTTPALVAPLSPEATRASFKQLCDAIRDDQVKYQGWDRLEHWVGTIQAIDTKLLGGQQVRINLDPPGAGTSHAIEFDLDATTARELVVGQPVVFSGTIHTYSWTAVMRNPPCIVELTDTTLQTLE